MSSVKNIFDTVLQEKICSLTEGTNSPRSVDCRLSNELYKPVPETSDRAERGMSPFRKEPTLQKRKMGGTR